MSTTTIAPSSASPLATNRLTQARDAAIGVVGFALLTALAAQVYIPLPHTPVPITAQTLVVTLAGAALGARLGTLSMLFYVLLGSVGYHVFATGNWGLATLLGPTGGYLLGFIAAQPLVAWLTRPAVPGVWDNSIQAAPVRKRLERRIPCSEATAPLRSRLGSYATPTERSAATAGTHSAETTESRHLRLLAAILVANVIIFACGLPWLAGWAALAGRSSDVPTILTMGLWPFLPGTLLKCALAWPLGLAALRWARPRFECP